MITRVYLEIVCCKYIFSLTLDPVCQQHLVQVSVHASFHVQGPLALALDALDQEQKVIQVAFQNPVPEVQNGDFPQVQAHLRKVAPKSPVYRKGARPQTVNRMDPVH